MPPAAKGPVQKPFPQFSRQVIGPLANLSPARANPIHMGENLVDNSVWACFLSGTLVCSHWFGLPRVL